MSPGVTLVEAMIAVAIVGIVAAFILSSYVLVLRNWGRHSWRMQSANAAWVLYKKVDGLLERSAELKAGSHGGWMLRNADTVQASIVLSGDTLLINGTPALMDGSVRAFRLARDVGVTQAVVVQCSLAVAARGQVSSLCWRRALAREAVPNGIPEPTVLADTSSLYWERR